VADERVTTEVDGRTLSLSNLDKPLYSDGFTKGQVIAYYLAVAEAMIPHLAGRPLTLRRWPDGTSGPGFFEKNVARTAPPWIPRLSVPSSTGGINTVSVEERAALVWVANLAGLELHVPQWRQLRSAGGVHPDRLVIDLDPGRGAGLAECAQVALLCRDRLADDGLTAFPKTSGSKGLQLYAGLSGARPWQDVHAYARDMAEDLERQVPRLVVSRMDKSLRPHRVLLDWSQNHAGKTTVAPYSLRGLATPTVSVPLRWEEVEAVALGEEAPESLPRTAAEAEDRVGELGDMLSAIESTAGPLPS
jgi:bifunctional non-homologous end joining protein LigD